MERRPRRIHAPWGALLLLVGCASGEPSGSFSGNPVFTFGSQEGGNDVTDGSGGTGGPGSGVMTGGADSGDSGGPGPDDSGGPGPGDSGTDDGPPPPGCMPLPEVCDGMDNDCDGVADNGDPGGGGACNTGMPGVCADGINHCVGGSVQCEPTVMAGAETCDGEDDDCDGAIDEGNPGGGAGCNTGMPGVCGPGTNNCVGGTLTCQANVPPGPEICGNGQDDDCDGAVDDGCGCPFGLCVTPGGPMINGCDPCVTSVCAADPFCCATAWDLACVDQVETVCGWADCISPACAHPVCSTGVALDSFCHGCVSTICLLDPYCCSTMWDSQCVNEVGTYCGLACP